MRKTVIDGSNTSGFQRSLMIGIDGYVETSEGKVGVWYVYLEEDAARIIGDDEGKKIYRLDRLGIPLVEIVTAPDIKSPEHARETALKIGEILRSCKVRRGIGTIRQDINVSIKGHPRAEIKGFQDPKIFVDVAKKEIARQQENLSKKIKDLKPEVRGANPDGSTKFLRPLPGSARMYPETDLPILKIHREFINDAKKTLPNLKSDEKKELKKHGLSEEMIGILFKENKLDDYRELLNILNNPQLVAKTLLIWPKDILAKEKKIINELNKDIFAEVLEAVKTGKIFEQDVKNVLSDIAKGKNLEEAIKIEKIDIAEIEEEIHKIIKEKPGLTSQGYMGLIMKEFKGKIDGKTTMDIIRKFMK
jgi:Glu-tRNA(Gln) amidotransferase subunit E-like FAD-binding protein